MIKEEGYEHKQKGNAKEKGNGKPNIVKPEPRPTVRARNRDVLSETNVNSDTSATSTEIMEVDNEYFPSDDETAR